MKLFSIAAAVAVALSAAQVPAQADTLVDVLLDFEGVTGFSPVTGYESAGITFGSNPSTGSDALGVVNDVLGTYFSNAPSPVGVLTVVGPDSALNVSSGFVNGVSFYYSALGNVSGVKVWDGLNGTGTLLGSIDLSANTAACTDVALCKFDQASISFTGTAKSLTFGDAATVGADFDNIHISAVPETSSIAMMVFGLTGLGLVARRRG